MPNKQFQPQDYQGNPIDLITSAEAVKTTSGSTVEAELTALKGSVSGQHKVYIKETITERDAIEDAKAGDRCWVKDATEDPTVTKGAAEYIYDGSAWVKLSEAESMDVVTKWEDIQGKEAVEAAMAKAHEHSNKALLDGISADDTSASINGKKIYVGRHVAILGKDDPTPEDMVVSGLILRAVADDSEEESAGVGG